MENLKPNKERVLIETKCVNGNIKMSYSGGFAYKRYFVSGPGYQLSTSIYADAVAKFRELSEAITIPM